MPVLNCATIPISVNMDMNLVEAQPVPHVAAPEIATARRVLQLEADALCVLARNLNGTFLQAVERLLTISGRVVVTGMGKSGHVARKIAATLASTGTPALFVHPSEASHGDLGMITEADAVLALSNSGETPELSDLVAYTRRFAIPLIALTRVADSALARAADTVLLLPDMPEACPMGLAPTTSTTMALALGDALAVALLERKGFTSEAFRTFHPGGKLGRLLVKVADLMHGPEELPLAGRETPMSEALLTMTERRFGCVGVAGRDGALIGIVTDGDLRRHMRPDLLQLTAGEVMTPAPKTIRPQALAGEALQLMNARSITALFVVEKARPVGILHIHDLLRASVA
jgi:arabinose-5-phosphate isomerase